VHYELEHIEKTLFPLRNTRNNDTVFTFKDIFIDISLDDWGEKCQSLIQET
jgi:hypothetical protein